jgi:hypothetical protein
VVVAAGEVGAAVRLGQRRRELHHGRLAREEQHRPDAHGELVGERGEEPAVPALRLVSAGSS